MNIVGIARTLLLGLLSPFQIRLLTFVYTSFRSTVPHIGMPHKVCGARSLAIFCLISYTFLRIDTRTIFESVSRRQLQHIASGSWEFADGKLRDRCTIEGGQEVLSHHLPVQGAGQ
jgi:hypothetical protein